MFEKPSVALARRREGGEGPDRRWSDGTDDSRETSPRCGGVPRRAAQGDMQQPARREMADQNREGQPLACALHEFEAQARIVP